MRVNVGSRKQVANHEQTNGHVPHNANIRSRKFIRSSLPSSSSQSPSPPHALSSIASTTSTFYNFLNTTTTSIPAILRRRIHRFQTYQLIFSLLPLAVLFQLIYLSTSPNSFISDLLLSTHLLHASILFKHHHFFSDSPHLFAPISISSPSTSLLSSSAALNTNESLSQIPLNTNNNALPTLYNDDIQAFIICHPHSPCCHDTISSSIDSLFSSQSLSPTSLTVIHSCLSKTHTNLLRLHSKPSSESAKLKLHKHKMVFCHHQHDRSTFDGCVLNSIHINSNSLSSPSPSSKYTLILSHAHILHPITVETLWLSLQLRSASIHGIFPLPYSLTSIDTASNPLQLRTRFPNTTLHVSNDDGTINVRKRPLSLTSPLLIRTSSLLTNHKKKFSEADLWKSYLQILSNTRVLRVPLFIDTLEGYQDDYDDEYYNNDNDFHFSDELLKKENDYKIQINKKKNRKKSDIEDLEQQDSYRSERYRYLLLSVDRQRAKFFLSSSSSSVLDRQRQPPAWLQSLSSFYKLSAQYDESDLFPPPVTSTLSSNIDLSNVLIQSSLTIPNENEQQATSSIMFIIPSLQMGGSETAILRLAKRFKLRHFRISFVLTTPHWSVDPLGEVNPHTNQWLSLALSITPDVHSLSYYGEKSSSRALRHFIESRNPTHIFISNSRFAYVHLKFIKHLINESSTIIADFNHMIHKDWNGGGLPRYGVNYTDYVDIHFTASDEVSQFMSNTSDSKHVDEKIKSCHIGSEIEHNSEESINYFSKGIDLSNIDRNKIIICFVGRFILEKGTDVIIDMIKQIAAQEQEIESKIEFLLIGDGDQKRILKKSLASYAFVHIFEPMNENELKNQIYQMNDHVVVLIPSVNEGITLVAYDAMVSGALVVSTDVGGQNEIIKHNETGILIPNSNFVNEISALYIKVLKDYVATVTNNGHNGGLRSMNYDYTNIKMEAKNLITSRFTREQFCDCIENILKSAYQNKQWNVKNNLMITNNKLNGDIDEVAMGTELKQSMAEELNDIAYQRKLLLRPLHQSLTIGIKTYICDKYTMKQIEMLLTSIRMKYPLITILLGNDGPWNLRRERFYELDGYSHEIKLPLNSGISYGRNALINATTTKYFMLLDDDHVLDDEHTNFIQLIEALESDKFDIIGLRIRNLPGIIELEQQGINIPRYVSNIVSFNAKTKKLVLCIWNENNGPGVFGMKHPLKVDIVHNSFIAKTNSLKLNYWNEQLHVNEHMSFFLNIWKKKHLNVGYLPSQFVHHKRRKLSKCYERVRFREKQFSKLLEYDEQLLYDTKCGENFPQAVARHMIRVQ